ncbi:MAG TPA: ABC transporter permease [Chloroflexota bacterium]|nr:ABC transporter permease [Chloroflexota bacterium]
MATTERIVEVPQERTAAAVLLEPPSHLKVAWYQVVYIIWYRDIVRYTRDRPRLLASFAQPVLYLAIFGVGLSSSLGSGFSRGSAGQSGASISYIQFMYPGVVAMSVLFIAVFSAMSVVWDREFGFLREILIAPVGRSWVALGKALGGATQAMLQGVIMLVLAPFVGVKLSVLSVIEVIPLLFVLAFGLTTLGVALATRLKSMQGFQVVMNFLLMPMFFLSGALFPLNRLPTWLNILTRFDPVAYGVAPIRAVVLGGSGLPATSVDRLTAITIGTWQVPSLVDVGILTAFGAVMLILAMRAFSHRA